MKKVAKANSIETRKIHSEEFLLIFQRQLRVERRLLFHKHMLVIDGKWSVIMTPPILFNKFRLSFHFPSQGRRLTKSHKQSEFIDWVKSLK